MVSIYKTQKMCRDDCLAVCFNNRLFQRCHTHTQSLGDVIGKEEGGAGSDHPVRRSFPEGNYLQALAAGSIQGIVGCTPTNVPLWEIPM